MKTWKLRLSKSGAIEFISSDGDHLALDDIAFYLSGLEREVARKRAAAPVLMIGIERTLGGMPYIIFRYKGGWLAIGCEREWMFGHFIGCYWIGPLRISIKKPSTSLSEQRQALSPVDEALGTLSQGQSGQRTAEPEGENDELG